MAASSSPLTLTITIWEDFIRSYQTPGEAVDKQDKKDLSIFGALLGLAGAAIGAVVAASKDDDKKTT
jgi:hypothetical protein